MTSGAGGLLPETVPLLPVLLAAVLIVVTAVLLCVASLGATCHRKGRFW